MLTTTAPRVVMSICTMLTTPQTVMLRSVCMIKTTAQTRALSNVSIMLMLRGVFRPSKIQTVLCTLEEQQFLYKSWSVSRCWTVHWSFVKIDLLCQFLSQAICSSNSIWFYIFSLEEKLDFTLFFFGWQGSSLVVCPVNKSLSVSRRVVHWLFVTISLLSQFLSQGNLLF